jgi:hypothetical protein
MFSDCGWSFDLVIGFIGLFHSWLHFANHYHTDQCLQSWTSLHCWVTFSNSDCSPATRLTSSQAGSLLTPIPYSSKSRLTSLYSQDCYIALTQITEKTPLTALLERLIFPFLRYIYIFFCFIKIVCVATCFGHMRPSSGQDAQFLSHQPHYFLPLLKKQKTNNKII